MSDKQLIIDGEQVDLADSTVIAVTYQINDFGNISSRQGNHSNRFKISASNNSNKRFGYANQVQSTSQIPYRKLPAKFITSGIELIRNGYATIASAGKDYNVNIFDGNSDFFAQLTGKKLSDLTGLPAFDHYWRLSDIIDSFTNTEGYIYPIIDYNNAIENYKIANPSASNVLTAYNMYPAYFGHTLLEMIVADAGWTMEGDILSDPRYLNYLLPFSKSVWEHSEAFATLQKFDVRLSADVSDSIAMTYDAGQIWRTRGLKTVDPVTYDDETTPPSFDNHDNFDNTIYKAVIQTAGYYTFEAQTKVDYTINPPPATSTAQGFMNFWLRIYKGATLLAEEVATQSAYIATVTIKVALSKTLFNVGDEIRVVLEMLPEYNFKDISNAYITDPSTCDYTIKSDNDTYFKNGFEKTIAMGTPIDATLFIPDMTQLDFVKSIFNTFCISPDGVSENKTLHLRAFDELSANISNAKDWTSKWVEQDPVIEFVLGNYFQKNDFTYKQDQGIPSLWGNGSFDIDNETLDPKGNVVDLPYGSSITSDQKYILDSAGIFSIPQINNFLNSGASQRVLMLRQYASASTITFTDGTHTDTATNLPLCHFYLDGRQDNVDWPSLLADYFTIIIATLQNAKKVTAQLRLTAMDVQDFDHFIPVYIGQLSAYFYVNKISNFKEAETTTVELIRI